MRQTVIVSALTAVVTVVLSVVVLNQLGAGTVSSASDSGFLESGNLATSEADLIQGDTDCDGDVDAVDGLGVLVNVAALEALGQQEPCTDVADVIPAGEGIPGPQGPAGPQGEQGPAGAQGAPGLSGVEIVDVESASNSNAEKNVTAPCPEGKTIVGGGARVLGSVFGVVLVNSHPFGDEQWQVRMVEREVNAGDWRAIAYAICANVAE